MDLISKIVDVAKLPAKFVAGIFIASGFVVLSPELWLEKVGMTQLQAGYRTYFGLAFILSAAYLMAMLLAWVGCKFQGWNLRRRWKRIVRDEMQSCDRNEKAVLREFLLQKRNTLRMPVD